MSATKVSKSRANASDRLTPASPPRSDGSMSASTWRMTIDSWKPSSSSRSGSGRWSRHRRAQKLWKVEIQASP